MSGLKSKMMRADRKSLSLILPKSDYLNQIKVTQQITASHNDPVGDSTNFCSIYQWVWGKPFVKFNN